MIAGQRTKEMEEHCTGVRRTSYTPRSLAPSMRALRPPKLGYFCGAITSRGHVTATAVATSSKYNKGVRTPLDLHLIV